MHMMYNKTVNPNNLLSSHPLFVCLFVCGFVTRLTLKESLMELELLTFPEHMSSPPGLSGVRVT